MARQPTVDIAMSSTDGLGAAIERLLAEGLVEIVIRPVSPTRRAAMDKAELVREWAAAWLKPAKGEALTCEELRAHYFKQTGEVAPIRSVGRYMAAVLPEMGYTPINMGGQRGYVDVALRKKVKQGGRG